MLSQHTYKKYGHFANSFFFFTEEPTKKKTFEVRNNNVSDKLKNIIKNERNKKKTQTETLTQWTEGDEKCMNLFQFVESVLFILLLCTKLNFLVDKWNHQPQQVVSHQNSHRISRAHKYEHETKMNPVVVETAKFLLYRRVYNARFSQPSN